MAYKKKWFPIRMMESIEYLRKCIKATTFKHIDEYDELMWAADDVEREIAELYDELNAALGGDDKSRWHELFGTPERAARTMAGKCGDCCECVLMGECSLEYCLLSCDGNAYRAKLLEWLRGDAE